MSLAENIILSLVKAKLTRSLDLKNLSEIPSDGLREYHDIPYTNRSGKELRMDIFEPIAPPGTTACTQRLSRLLSGIPPDS